jgi:hypothetical protein
VPAVPDQARLVKGEELAACLLPAGRAVRAAECCARTSAKMILLHCAVQA